jgi:hypothetical protein
MCLLLFSYPSFPSPKVSGIMSITGVLRIYIAAIFQALLIKPSTGMGSILYKGDGHILQTLVIQMFLRTVLGFNGQCTELAMFGQLFFVYLHHVILI